MGRFVLGFEEIDRSLVSLVGGKGAHLGELGRIEGIDVPPGFCISTEAFRRIMADAAIDEQLDRLFKLDPDRPEAIRARSLEIRRTIEATPVPEELADEITGALCALGEQTPCAVRSSATAEDSATTSFAGQQDTYLNVVGPTAVLEHVSRCWASLFSERAMTYRLRRGSEARHPLMAVVVQQMLFPESSGVLFTADPVTSNRKIALVESTFGLGEALVSGLVTPDLTTVRADEVVARAVATKTRAVVAAGTAGTRVQAVEPERQQQPALTDAQVLGLVQLGRRIEAHFGQPQDIEWCLVDGAFQIVQSRPITTLFPLPAVSDHDNHVYVSVGHQQMMTDAMKPLGLSVWQLTTPRPMAEAGGRLFVDVARLLASPTSRAYYLEALGRSDPLIGSALQTILDRGDFIPALADEEVSFTPIGEAARPIETDPALVTELIEQGRAALAALERDIEGKSGAPLLDFISTHLREWQRIMFDPRSMQVIVAAMDASWSLNEKVQEWLGDKNAVDPLTQSVPHNVTSEMGLALLDVADVIRPHADVVAFLGHVEDEHFLDELPKFAGGQEAKEAIASFLDRYGMRCVGEIDITRPRWSERPSMLVPLLLSNVENFEPGAGKRRFQHGLEDAQQKEDELLARLRALPDGAQKAQEAKALIDRVRTFIGYREYPKYLMVSRYFVYKQALLREAERLVQAHVLSEPDDVYYLRFDELEEVVRSNKVDEELIARRKAAFRSYQPLTPPRVFTSEGEVVNGTYGRADDVPPGALVGLAVSAGTVEGRARVILDVTQASLESGDILVTAYTDPSWTPAFVALGGLVTEVGGLMTHGAVIAREYGLPAVVGVEHATRLIRDGQRIRVRGSDGYVEILPETHPAHAG